MRDRRANPIPDMSNIDRTILLIVLLLICIAVAGCTPTSGPTGPTPVTDPQTHPQTLAPDALFFAGFTPAEERFARETWAEVQHCLGRSFSGYLPITMTDEDGVPCGSNHSAAGCFGQDGRFAITVSRTWFYWPWHSLRHEYVHALLFASGEDWGEKHPAFKKCDPRDEYGRAL